MLSLQQIDAALLPRAARWFSDGWGVPAQAEAAGRQTVLTQHAAVPCWWAMLNKWDVIVAGAGLTENDLQEPDVANIQPYVTPAYSDGR